MTRSALAPRLTQHYPEPRVELHPATAAYYRLQEGHIASIESVQGQVLARVWVTTQVPPQQLFLAMHWSSALSRNGHCNTLVHRRLDPYSHQPGSKSTPCKIRPWAGQWYGALLTFKPQLQASTPYSVHIPGPGHWLQLLASQKPLPDSGSLNVWQTWEISLFSGVGVDAQRLRWVVTLDQKLGYYRALLLKKHQPYGVLLVHRDPQALPDCNWLKAQFSQWAGQSLTRAQCLNLLAARPATAADDPGRLVCACQGVGEHQLIRAIKAGAQSVAALGIGCQAGVSCGSCIPQLKQLLRQHQATESTHQSTDQSVSAPVTRTG